MDEPQSSPKYDIFFYVAEFLFGCNRLEIILLFTILSSDKTKYLNIDRYVLPLIALVCLYLTDSYVGKPIAAYVTCAMGIVMQLTVIISQAAQLPFNDQVVYLLMSLVADVLKPIRWSLMYTIKPIRPFKIIRRFVILTEISYYFGVVTTKAFIIFLKPDNIRYRLDIIIPTAVTLNLILYPLFVHLIYERARKCPMHFKIFSVEKAAKDVHSVILKNICKKCHRYQQPRAERNKELGMGILVVMIISIPYTMATYDYEIIKVFSAKYHDFLIGKSYNWAAGLLIPIVTILFLLLIEFGLLAVKNFNEKFHPYYISWMTYSFFMVIVALIIMVYIYLTLETNIPYSKPPHGQAHMTVFNCLPASIEIEWPREGKIVRVLNQNYMQELLIPLKDGQTEVMEVLVYNKPISMYQRVNVTLEEGRENVFVATYDGLIHANMTEKVSFDKFKNDGAQIRVVDCFEVCCHGSVSFTPTRPTSRRSNSSIQLSTNLLSPKQTIASGEYQLAYQPDTNSKFEMGTVKVRRYGKIFLLLHSFHKPNFRVWDTVTLRTKNTAAYIPMIILAGLFRVARPFQKLAIIMKTKPEIYSFMFGMYVVMDKIGSFGATAFYMQDDLNQNDFFIILGFSLFGFVVYLAVVLKLKKHFQVEDEKVIQNRLRSSSKSSTMTVDTTGPSDLLGNGKQKNQ